jgi:hypothetical protein
MDPVLSFLEITGLLGANPPRDLPLGQALLLAFVYPIFGPQRRRAHRNARKLRRSYCATRGLGSVIEEDSVSAFCRQLLWREQVSQVGCATVSNGCRRSFNQIATPKAQVNFNPNSKHPNPLAHKNLQQNMPEVAHNKVCAAVADTSQL